MSTPAPDYLQEVFIYHPHGSFDTQDVVCSLRQEQRQLPVSPFEIDLLTSPNPILFLGYSGYEPSLYGKLESSTEKQLWCIRDLDDLNIPAKRRLLCRPNVFVYVGDLRELLRSLGVLEVDVDFTSVYLGREGPDIPPQIIKNLQIATISSLDIDFCINELSSTFLSLFDELEPPTLFPVPMKALVNHVRNRTIHAGIVPTLLAVAGYHDSEQVWITILAYLLRVFPNNLGSQTIDKLIKFSQEAAQRANENDYMIEDIIFTNWACLGRTGGIGRSDIYRYYVGHQSKFDDFEDSEPLEHFSDALHRIGIASGDLALAAEYMEILAFSYLRGENPDYASNCFELAANYFYLQGLWKAGALNEWASNNADRLVDISKANTLVIPMEKLSDSDTNV